MTKLHAAGVDSPRRDSLVLLEDTIKKDRAWVLAHPEHDLPSQTIKDLEKLIIRRTNREPLAYIRGKAWFYRRFFAVSPDVMIPRPESENFIDLLKEIQPSSVVDIGTGSGCLAITAKLELPKTDVLATDISQNALKIAEQNAKKHRADIHFLQGSLLKPLTKFDLSNTAIIANLPYVPKGLITGPEITTEPAGALFAGQAGLDIYRNFWKEVVALAQKPQYILTEALESQHNDLQELAQKSGYQLQKAQNLIQVFKN
jgi:release factor glutamine methyltransferase